MSTNPAETGTPSSVPIRCADRSAGTFPKAASKIAAAFSTGPWLTVPAWAADGAAAVVTAPQHGHLGIGSSHPVAFRAMLTSATCVHDEPASCAPVRLVPHREHCAGGRASFRSSGSRCRDSPVPG